MPTNIEPRDEAWTFSGGDVNLLWRAVSEVCGGNVCAEIKDAYKRLYRETYGHEVDDE